MKIDIKKVAKLANLTLTDAEIRKFESQLSSILEYFEQLKKVDISNALPTSQTTGLENVTRDDEESPCLSQDEALSNAKSTHNELFKVKSIFDD